MIISRTIKLYRKTRKRIVYECSCDQCHSLFELTPGRVKHTVYHFCSRNCQRIAQLKDGVLDKHKRSVWLKKTGVEHPMHDPKVLERYVNPYSRQDVKTKIKLTLNERYGVDNPMKSDSIKKRMKQSMIKKYGSVDHFYNVLLEKRTSTNIKRYGVENCMQRQEVIAKQKKTAVLRGVKRYQSKLELHVEQLLRQEFSEVHTQKWINGSPIDFYLPEFNVFIQVDGEFYHGLTERSRQYDFVMKNIERDNAQNLWFMSQQLMLLRLDESTCRSIACDQLKNKIISFVGQWAPVQ